LYPGSLPLLDFISFALSSERAWCPLTGRVSYKYPRPSTWIPCVGSSSQLNTLVVRSFEHSLRFLVDFSPSCHSFNHISKCLFFLLHCLPLWPLRALFCPNRETLLLQVQHPPCVSHLLRILNNVTDSHLVHGAQGQARHGQGHLPWHNRLHHQSFGLLEWPKSCR
jgi:hypothetical protein